MNVLCNHDNNPEDVTGTAYANMNTKGKLFSYTDLTKYIFNYCCVKLMRVIQFSRLIPWTDSFMLDPSLTIVIDYLGNVQVITIDRLS